MRTVDAAGLAIGDGHPTRVMGVVNLSPESPYAPSVFDDPAEAAAYVDEALLAEGADIVDVGLESANKRFDVRPAAWELDRLDLALETVDRVAGDAVFSIETRYAEVAAAALDGGFDLVNDIAGFADPAMPEVCEARDAAVVKMAGPGDLERPGAVESVDDIYAALERGGLTDKTIVDPAFGGWSDAKTLEDDRETLRRLREFRALDRPILVSINRKNFLRDLADRSTEEALPVSLAATALAVERGADVVRTHDVAETVDAVRVGDAFSREHPRDDGVEALDVTTVREAERHLAALERAAGRVEGTGTVGGAARDVVARCYRVDGLDGDGAHGLLEAADAVGAVAVVGDDRALVGGSVAALDALADRLEGTALDRVADALRE